MNAASAMQWADFVRRMLPELIKVGRALYERYQGDTTAAKRELVALRDHWAQLDQERARIDAELERLERKT